MKRFLSFTALLILFFTTHSNLIQAQGIDELMGMLDDKADDYRLLADQITDIADNLVDSENALDSKGAELNQLVLDLAETLKISNSMHTALENDMDTFESGCFNMQEEQCPELEKEVEKFTWGIEPILELGIEPSYILEEIDNRYDEKFILKSLAKANKAALKVASELEDLKEELRSLAEKRD